MEIVTQSTVRMLAMKKKTCHGFIHCVPQSLCPTKVGFLPALVSHEEIQMWAADAEIEEKDSNLRDLDDWERAERSLQEAARQAKIVAVSLNENSVYLYAGCLSGSYS